MELAPEVQWRVSKRGLVIAASDGETVLLEHPRAADLPLLAGQALSPAELAYRLGPPNAGALLAELTELDILRDPAEAPVTTSAPTTRRVALTRSGVEITGIDRPAQWFARHAVPLLSRWPVRAALVATVVAGIVSLLLGRPDGPQVSTQPMVDALLGFTIAMVGSALHEFAHAVALAHYGRRSRRAGFGFYWGSISFYVDSTEALTLPRRARVIQALAGLAVDVVAVSLLALTAQLSTSVLLTAVAWRLAVLGLLDIGINLAPVLQVDGHWALADLLDEPDLGPRARTALGAAVRRRSDPNTPSWLAGYGALSLICGTGLLIVSGLVFWLAARDLIVALFSGNPAEIAVGVLLVLPVVASLIFSTLGLLLEVALGAAAPADREVTTARTPTA